jgi:hypothetical protein
MNWLEKGPGYTVNDLVYYTGLFLGIILVFGVGRPYGFHPLLLLVGGLAAGVGLGYVLERTYRNSRRNFEQGGDTQDHDPRDTF